MYYAFQLFGPKWGSSSVPRYVGNIGPTPLQPQRPTSIINAAYNDTSTNEKQSKATDTWSDPFSTSGQDCKLLVTKDG